MLASLGVVLSALITGAAAVLLAGQAPLDGRPGFGMATGLERRPHPCKAADA